MNRSTITKSILISIGLIAAFGSVAYAQLQVPKKTAYGRGYLEYLPAGYSTSTELYPCIIFLHGSGERGDGSPTELQKVTSNGPPKLIKAGNTMCFTVNSKLECFVVLSPQTLTWGWGGEVTPFVQYALQTYRIDPNRIYLTGLSMGGLGTWVGASEATNSPNYFAALSSMAGQGTAANGCAVAGKKLPMWAFHGDADTSIPVISEQKAINGMISCGANPPPIFTIYPGAGHGQTWTKGYTPNNTIHNPNVYEWFLSYKRPAPVKTPPIVNAGNDITITLPTNVASVLGTANDLDGTIASVAWSKVTGPSGPGFTAINALATDIKPLIAGVYTFRLTATDNEGFASSDYIVVTVNPVGAPKPPVASAGTDKTIIFPASTISLVGSGTDTDGTIASYLWTQDAGPPPAAILTGSTTSTLNVSGMVNVGSYSFSLKVTDNSGLSNTDQVVVTVLAPPPNAPPNANAGSDRTITIPTSSLTLSGTGTDSDGTVVSYQWVQASGPGPTTTFGTPSAASTLVSGLTTAGSYVYTLTVTDDKGSNGTDQIIVTVLPTPPNALPIASAGADIVITLPINGTTLNGIGTDIDGTIATYSWTKTNGPSTFTIGSPSAASTGISGLVAGNYVFTLTVTDNVGGVGSDQVQVQVLPVPPNQPPVASAGTNVSITLPISTVSLSGTGTDSDGTIAQYLWTQQNGPVGSTATIVTPSQNNTQINGLTIPGVYTFELQVTDNNGAKGSDQVSVTVFPAANIAPTANAGTDGTITFPISTFPLVGSGTDSDGTITTYLWAQVSGPSVATFGNNAAAATSANSLVSGIYIFSLTVTDNSGAKSADQIQVTVLPQPPNQPPIANAGPDVILKLPANSTTLNGSGTDADGTVTGYHWNLLSGPTNINLSDIDLQNLDVSSLLVGIYVFELVIVDDRGAIATDQVKIFVDAANQPPVSNAGSDITITFPTNSVVITGIGTDPDGTVATYEWQQTSGPNTSSINDLNASQITVTGLIEGIYVFSLMVTDNEGVNDFDNVRVVVNPEPPNSPPVANAGPDLNITLPVSAVTITGSGSDSDGTIASYQWSQVSGVTTASPTDVNLATITFSNLTDGIYVFRLTVTDNKGAKGQKDVNVRVNPQPLNIPPTANAGTDAQIIRPVDFTNLTGIGTDSDGTIASYAWTQINGTGAIFTPPNSANTNASNLAEGIYVFRLTVTDDKGATGFDEVTITVKPIPANLPPIANAGANKILTFPAQSSTVLNGSGNDLDGTITAYNWINISGSPFTPSDLTLPSLTISDLQEGIYLFRLTVTDNDGSTGFDEVNIRVQPVAANLPPTANAGTNKIITLPTSNTSFNGLGTDPDGTIATYAWTVTSAPPLSSPPGLTGIATSTLGVSALEEGTYIFKLTVTDNTGASGFDEVNVRVNQQPPNAPPVVNAGIDRTIISPVISTAITGSATDIDGSIASYAWTQVSGDPASLSGISTSTLTVTAPESGIYIFRLTATDNLGLIAFDEVQLTVNPAPPNQSPLVDAGIDQSIIIPLPTITLSGTTSDPDGTVVSTLWSLISGPTGSILTTPAALTTTVTGLQIGTYIFELESTDNVGEKNIDQVTVSVAGNKLPIAFAGNAINLILPNNTAQLSGGGVDSDGSIASFEWSQVSGPVVLAAPADQQNLTLNSLSTGTYIFKLKVLDDKGESGYDSVTVTVAPTDLPPTANAGQDITINLPVTTATLNGSGTDPDGTIASYFWLQISGPAATLSDASLKDLIVTDLLETTVYVFELTVTDNLGLSASDQVTITVLPTDSVPAIAKVPKIFSPNGDGKNDVWAWGSDLHPSCRLIIFNRFGKKVYETTSYDATWDGRSSNGQVLEEEAYYYVVKCDGSKDITGGVRIVR